MERFTVDGYVEENNLDVQERAFACGEIDFQRNCYHDDYIEFLENIEIYVITRKRQLHNNFKIKRNDYYNNVV